MKRVLILCLALVLAVGALAATPWVGSDYTASGTTDYAVFFNITAARTITVFAPDANLKVSFWRDGTKYYPTDAAGDTTITVPAGVPYNVSGTTIDQLYITRDTATEAFVYWGQ